MQRIFKYGDIENTVLLHILYTFLPHHILESYSFKNGPNFLAHPVDRKSAISLQRGQFDPKFQVEGDVPHQ